jgi:phage gp36-like protein
VSSYATPADLYAYGAPESAFGDVDPTAVQAALDAASTQADGYLANRFTLPVVTPSQDLKAAVCQIAAWNLLRRRGFNPEDLGAQAIRTGYEDAERWLRGVSKGEITPQLTDSSAGVAPPGGSGGGAFVVQPQATGQTDSAGYPVYTAGVPRHRGWR